MQRFVIAAILVIVPLLLIGCGRKHATIVVGNTTARAVDVEVFPYNMPAMWLAPGDLARESYAKPLSPSEVWTIRHPQKEFSRPLVFSITHGPWFVLVRGSAGVEAVASFEPHRRLLIEVVDGAEGVTLRGVNRRGPDASPLEFGLIEGDDYLRWREDFDPDNLVAPKVH